MEVASYPQETVRLFVSTRDADCRRFAVCVHGGDSIGDVRETLQRALKSLPDFPQDLNITSIEYEFEGDDYVLTDPLRVRDIFGGGSAKLKVKVGVCQGDKVALPVSQSSGGQNRKVSGLPVTASPAKADLKARGGKDKSFGQNESAEDVEVIGSSEPPELFVLAEDAPGVKTPEFGKRTADAEVLGGANGAHEQSPMDLDALHTPGREMHMDEDEPATSPFGLPAVQSIDTIIGSLAGETNVVVRANSEGQYRTDVLASQNEDENVTEVPRPGVVGESLREPVVEGPLPDAGQQGKGGNVVRSSPRRQRQRETVVSASANEDDNVTEVPQLGVAGGSPREPVLGGPLLDAGQQGKGGNVVRSSPRRQRQRGTVVSARTNEDDNVTEIPQPGVAGRSSREPVWEGPLLDAGQQGKGGNVVRSSPRRQRQRGTVVSASANEAGNVTEIPQPGVVGKSSREPMVDIPQQQDAGEQGRGGVVVRSSPRRQGWRGPVGTSSANGDANVMEIPQPGVEGERSREPVLEGPLQHNAGQEGNGGIGQQEERERFEGHDLGHSGNGDHQAAVAVDQSEAVPATQETNESCETASEPYARPSKRKHGSKSRKHGENGGSGKDSHPSRKKSHRRATSKAQSEMKEGANEVETGNGVEANGVDGNSLEANGVVTGKSVEANGVEGDRRVEAKGVEVDNRVEANGVETGIRVEANGAKTGDRVEPAAEESPVIPNLVTPSQLPATNNSGKARTKRKANRNHDECIPVDDSEGPPAPVVEEPGPIADHNMEPNNLSTSPNGDGDARQPEEALRREPVTEGNAGGAGETRQSKKKRKLVKAAQSKAEQGSQQKVHGQGEASSNGVEEPVSHSSPQRPDGQGVEALNRVEEDSNLQEANGQGGTGSQGAGVICPEKVRNAFHAIVGEGVRSSPRKRLERSTQHIAPKADTSILEPGENPETEQVEGQLPGANQTRSSPRKARTGEDAVIATGVRSDKPVVLSSDEASPEVKKKKKRASGKRRKKEPSKSQQTENGSKALDAVELTDDVDYNPNASSDERMTPGTARKRKDREKSDKKAAVEGDQARVPCSFTSEQPLQK